MHMNHFRMSLFPILALFGFIQVGLSASIIEKRYEGCGNDNDKALRVFGLTCDKARSMMDDNPRITPKYCGNDDFRAICPDACTLCYAPGAGIEDYDGGFGGHLIAEPGSDDY